MNIFNKAKGWISSTASYVGGILGELTGQNEEMEIAEQNLALSKEQFQYQKDLQNKIFGREDTAIQRRVSDLKSAGLSPVLAAGQGAAAGAVVSTTTPKQDVTSRPNLLQAAAMVGSLMKMKADIAKSNSERALINAQHSKTTIDTIGSKIKNSMDMHNLRLSKKSGTYTSPSAVGKLYRDLVGMSEGTTVKSIKEGIRSKIKDMPVHKGNKVKVRNPEQWKLLKKAYGR